MSGVIDLRSDEERAFEERGKSSLAGDDEAIARKLVELNKRSDYEFEHDKPAYDKTYAEIRHIGQALCDEGGDARMKEIAYRYAALGGRIRSLEMFWNRICGWMA